MRKEKTMAVQRDARALRGMSLIEVLVAASLLLVISLAILALLTRALQNNTRGWEATQSSNLIRTELDQHLGEELTAPDVTVAPGTTEIETESFWAAGSDAFDNDDDEGWYDVEGDAQGRILVERKRTVRQYNVSSLIGDPTGYSDKGEFVYEISQAQIDSPLTGDVDPRFANVKRIDLEIQGRRQAGPLGAGQRLKADTYKAY